MSRCFTLPNLAQIDSIADLRLCSSRNGGKSLFSALFTLAPKSGGHLFVRSEIAKLCNEATPVASVIYISL